MISRSRASTSLSLDSRTSFGSKKTTSTSFGRVACS